MTLKRNNKSVCALSRSAMIGIYFIASLAAVLFLSGCFTSVLPIFDEKQIVQEDRVVGAYEDKRAGNSWRVERSPDDKGRYRFLLSEGNSRIEFLGTFFRLDDILYLDLYPLSDSAMHHEPAGPPTLTELFHAVTFESRHVLWKIQFSTNGFVFWFPSHKGAAAAIKDAPELRSRARPVGEKMMIILLPESKNEAQAYLRRFGTNNAVFDQKGEMVKASKNP